MIMVTGPPEVGDARILAIIEVEAIGVFKCIHI
jgi:hypothetical protein